jgi:hypothetical protein
MERNAATRGFKRCRTELGITGTTFTSTLFVDIRLEARFRVSPAK